MISYEFGKKTTYSPQERMYVLSGDNSVYCCIYKDAYFYMYEWNHPSLFSEGEWVKCDISPSFFIINHKKVHVSCAYEAAEYIWFSFNKDISAEISPFIDIIAKRQGEEASEYHLPDNKIHDFEGMWNTLK